MPSSMPQCNCCILRHFHRKRDILFEGKKDTFRKVLYDLGFQYSKRNPKKYLIEKKDVARRRFSFLVKYHELHTGSPRPHFFSQDESYLNEQGTGKGRSWHDNNVKGCSQQSASLGARYIMCDIASCMGWLPGAGMFVRGCKNPQPNDDYHGDMEGDSWLNWAKQKCLPNLPKNDPVVIMMDNASYHTVQANFCYFKQH